MADLNLWYSLLFLFIAGMTWLFLRSLNLGEKFRKRQELRREQYLERQRLIAAEQASQRALTSFGKTESKQP